MDWKTAWSYLPVNYNTCIGTVSNLTQRTWFKNNLNGSKIKIRFSNLFSEYPLVFEKVVIGKGEKEKTGIVGTKVITYNGYERILIEPETEFYSDEIDFCISAGEELVISVYVKDEVKICSLCTTWSAGSWHTGYALQGDYTTEQTLEEKDSFEVFPVLQFDKNKPDVLFGISEIKVYTDNTVRTVALFGDSITHMSYYSDSLTDVLYRTYPGQITVVNRGLGGNRLLRDYSNIPEIPGGGTIFGAPGRKRFYADVYGSEQPEYVFVLIGINDFTHPSALKHYEEAVTVEEYIEGITELIHIAHQNKSKIMIGTMTPFKWEDMDWFSTVEELRQKANEWIRSQRLSDGIIDFDLATRQSEQPETMLADCHIGDGLHPNTEGGRRMAAAVPMTWFQ